MAKEYVLHTYNGILVSHKTELDPESWTIMKAEHQGIDAWKGLLRGLWTARRSNQSILKEISIKYALEGLMLKLKL